MPFREGAFNWDVLRLICMLRSPIFVSSKKRLTFTPDDKITLQKQLMRLVRLQGDTIINDDGAKRPINAEQQMNQAIEA